MASRGRGNDLDARTHEALDLLVRHRELMDSRAGLDDTIQQAGSSGAAADYEHLHAINRKNDALAELGLVERKLRELGVDVEGK